MDIKKMRMSLGNASHQKGAIISNTSEVDSLTYRQGRPRRRSLVGNSLVDHPPHVRSSIGYRQTRTGQLSTTLFAIPMAMVKTKSSHLRSFQTSQILGFPNQTVFRT
jgi:hypothetical protein